MSIPFLEDVQKDTIIADMSLRAFLSHVREAGQRLASEAKPHPPGSQNPLSVPSLSTMAESVTEHLSEQKVPCDLWSTEPVFWEKEKHII